MLGLNVVGVPIFFYWTHANSDLDHFEMKSKTSW